MSFNLPFKSLNHFDDGFVFKKTQHFDLTLGCLLYDLIFLRWLFELFNGDYRKNAIINYGFDNLNFETYQPFQTGLILKYWSRENLILTKSSSFFVFGLVDDTVCSFTYDAKDLVLIHWRMIIKKY